VFSKAMPFGAGEREDLVNGFFDFVAHSSGEVTNVSLGCDSGVADNRSLMHSRISANTIFFF
jgi:hypothetical protein